MTDKQSTTKTSRPKKTGGGTAVGGGMNFQAAVTVIVGIHILRGTALNWLEGICNDIPSAVWAESEGPGDDLCIELKNDSRIEVQAKKGLKRGQNLWSALHSIAEAIHKGELTQGVLVVDSSSSRTIHEDLADDIMRLGQGRTDLLKDISEEWVRRLKEASIPVQKVCRCMRIKVIHTHTAQSTCVSVAKEMLSHICARSEDVNSAWSCLFQQAVILIANRGRWTLHDLVLLLKSSNIAIRVDNFPASVLDRYTKWIIDINGYFFITGIKRKIPLKHLLPMRLEKTEIEPPPSNDASLALERYHKNTEHSPWGDKFDSIWTARFKTQVVVVAGPGLGKSTMIKQLAHQYAKDGFLVLRVELKLIAAAIQNGIPFSELLLNHALDGSQLSSDQVKSAIHLNWVILSDGLDECGSDHYAVAEQISRYASGHPNIRIVVTTRPIGYDTVELSHWPHYRLLPPKKEEGSENLAKLLRGVRLVETPSCNAPDLSMSPHRQAPPSDAISISPQLLGMSASLIYHRRSLPSTRLGLYIQLLDLFEKLPSNISPGKADTYSAVLNIVGWNLLSNPLISYDELIDRTATILAPMIDSAHLVAKEEVRLAVANWERVGLVEKVFHEGTALLTFIHKTFCEFVASRFLVQHSKNLIEEVVDNPDLHEVINFAVGQGLADELIKLYLDRYTSGQPSQLQPALALLGNKEINVSDRWAKELVQQSFKAIEDGANDKFRIGIALSEVGAKARHLVESLAVSKLEAANPAIQLTAWAIVLRCNSTSYDVKSLTATLAKLLPNVEPLDIVKVIKGQDRGDRDLLQIIALAALEAQPDDCIRSFAEHELQNEIFQAVGFRLEVNYILKSRGIEELPSPFSNTENTENIGPRVTLSHDRSLWKETTLDMARSVATAFANDKSEANIDLKHHCAFPQFSGLMRATGFIELTSNDALTWAKQHDEIAVHSTMKAIAQLTNLDLQALEEESREILIKINKNSYDSIFSFLTTVDIDPPMWSEVASVSINREGVMRGLLHSSVWINQIAASICTHLQMKRHELKLLLHKAEGHSLRCVIVLILENHSEEATQLLLQRLSKNSSGDVSSIFDFLCLSRHLPSTELMDTALECLCSNDTNTAKSATEFLIHCADQNMAIDEETVAKAVEHWGGHDSKQHFRLLNTPTSSLIELLDRTRTAR